MNICLVTDAYPRLFPFGGIATYTRSAAQSLARRGHQVHVLVTRKNAAFEDMDGEVRLHVRKIRWLPLVGRLLPGLGESLTAAWALFWLHRKYRFDVVEFPNWDGIGAVSAWLRLAPIVVRLHTSTVETLEAQGRPPAWGDRFTIWLERSSARNARRIITHSEAHKDRMLRAYGLKDIAVVQHGTDIPSARKEVAQNPRAVLVVGRLTARKGAKTLLQAIPLVLEKVPNAEFWLAGAELDHPLAREFTARNPASAQVRFMGFVSPEKLEELYAGCGVYASASVYESFGLTFIEAMAHGKPVIGCAAGAIPELIQPEVNGLLAVPNDAASFADAIIRLLQDGFLRQKMGQTGYRLATDMYSTAKMAERLENLFRGL